MLPERLLSHLHAWMIGAALIGVCATLARAADTPPSADPSLPPSQTAGVAIPVVQIDLAIAKVDGLARDVMRRTGIPGLAVAVVRDGNTVFQQGYGVRRAGAPDRVDADTVFQIASLSKSVGATVVARAVGQHIVAWDTPVARYLPWFALDDDWVTRHVTIADLYAHRSGLPDHAGDDLEDVGFDRQTILRRLRYLPLHSFRDSYAYTNFGLTAAAEAVAAAAGSDWATLSEDMIYRPLGMASTSSRFADFVSRPNHAVGHVKTAGGAFAPLYQRQPDAQSPAGGVSSSVRDMARWMAMVLQGGVFEGQRIVAEDALLPAITARIISSPSADVTARPGLYGYGFGVGIEPSGRTVISHSGAFAMGAATNYLMIPSAGVGIVALSNAAPVGAVEALDAMFADLVQFGSVTRDWVAGYGRVLAPLTVPFGALVGKAPPDHPAPAADPQVYAGTYGNDYCGDVRIARRGDGLVLTIGPAGTTFPLRHWDGNVFVYYPSDENAPDGSIATATFTLDDPNRASALALEVFAASGRGELARR